MRWIVVTLLTLCCINTFGQGKINIIQDQRIDDLIKKQIKNNQVDPKIEGFRVQIHFSDNQSRVASEKVRTQFSNDFPELKTYLEFKAPYYKIQAGDFINKLDAFIILKEISKRYVGAYIVKAEIYFEEVYKKN
jgi:hypothetical protein